MAGSMNDQVVSLLELVVQKLDNLETRIDAIVESIEYKKEDIMNFLNQKEEYDG